MEGNSSIQHSGFFTYNLSTGRFSLCPLEPTEKKVGTRVNAECVRIAAQKLCSSLAMKGLKILSSYGDIRCNFDDVKILEQDARPTSGCFPLHKFSKEELKKLPKVHFSNFEIFPSKN